MSSYMKTKHYLVPEIQIIALQQEGILCSSDAAQFGTGASWNVEDLSDDDIIIY